MVHWCDGAPWDAALNGFSPERRGEKRQCAKIIQKVEYSLKAALEGVSGCHFGSILGAISLQNDDFGVLLRWLAGALVLLVESSA